MIISTESELAAFCARARGFDAVAVDTEFLRERTFHPRLCLVQVATPAGEVVAIDPLALDDLAPLAGLLSDPAVIKVFHACSQDMEVLLGTLGALPAPIFDTQVAAAFLGERLQISYNGLVHAFCGVTLPKSESLTDWSRRPLTESQVEYALDDVRYLIRAYGAMRARLAELGRLSWVLDETRPLASLAHYQTDRREAYKRVKRITSLTRRQMAVARELAAWREGRAERCDIPRKMGHVRRGAGGALPPRPAHRGRLPQHPGAPSSSRKTMSPRRSWPSTAAGAARPIACRPCTTPARPPRAETDSVCDLMYALIRLVSERSGVATAMIASRDDLLDYIDHPERSALREGWRFELVGTRLDDLLAGNMGLTVKDRRVEIL